MIIAAAARCVVELLPFLEIPMATVLKLPLQDISLRMARQDRGLSLTQAACALGIAPVTLESWEIGQKSQVSIGRAHKAYDDFVGNTDKARRTGTNLLFGCFPMRVARDILGLTIQEISSLFDYAPSYWKKIEANARYARPDVIEELERRISARMAAVCESK
ncbi:MAG: XRE family transcriptional regulator [Alphaproteobacteria bacterium]|nr:MAG: XRE family transcriptional regulator [Alphaproteobacteria bacterium]